MADDDGDRRGRDDDADGDDVDEHVDEYDDDDDYYDDDDYDDPDVDEAAAAKRRRDTWLVAGAAAIIIIAVLVIVLKGDDKKTDTGEGSSTDSGQVADGGSSTTTSPTPVWPEEARHPPKGLEGDGKATPGAAPLAPGVYFWYSDFNGWYVKVIHGNGVGALKVGVADTTPQGSPVAIKDAAPTGVTVNTISPSSISLDVADSTEPQLVHLDVNGLVGSLTWTFDGVPTSQVFMGVSPGPVGSTPFTVAKQAPAPK